MLERLDIVIFGATGFTGKYVVEELHRISKYYEAGITWGIAGRSEAKLQSILNKLCNSTGENFQNVKVIIADVKDEDSLKKMASQTKVLINSCGPYRFYGEAVVKACIESGTHHVDVSGEPAYMELMQLKYDEAAKKAGVYVISACGFDSIPSDLGVIYLQQNFKGIVNSCETYIHLLLPQKGNVGNTVFNYATWESLVNGFSEASELKTIRKELHFKRLPALKPKLIQRPILHKSSLDNQWYVPFMGADRPVVNRTQRFLLESENTRPAQFQAYYGFPHLSHALTYIFIGAVINLLTKYSYGKKMLLNHPKLFTLGVVSHNGPSENSMKNTKFVVSIFGEGWNEDEIDIDGKVPSRKMRIQVSGENPCYGATCTYIIYSALTILKEENIMPGTGGVLTPGAAFAKTTLIENLKKHALKFEVVSIDEKKAKL